MCRTVHASYVCIRSFEIMVEFYWTPTTFKNRWWKLAVTFQKHRNRTELISGMDKSVQFFLFFIRWSWKACQFSIFVIRSSGLNFAYTLFVVAYIYFLCFWSCVEILIFEIELPGLWFIIVSVLNPIFIFI